MAGVWYPMHGRMAANPKKNGNISDITSLWVCYIEKKVFILPGFKKALTSVDLYEMCRFTAVERGLRII